MMNTNSSKKLIAAKSGFDERVAQIRRRLTPENIAGEAIRLLSVSASRATAAVVGTPKRNPLLVLGLAAAAGYWFLSILQKRNRLSNHRHPGTTK